MNITIGDFVKLKRKGEPKGRIVKELCDGSFGVLLAPGALVFARESEMIKYSSHIPVARHK